MKKNSKKEYTVDDLKDFGIKSFKLLTKALIFPICNMYGLLSDVDDPLCRNLFDIKHDWAYWDGHYTCKDPNIDDFKRIGDFRQCTKCKLKQSWAHWGGISGDGKWYETNHDLPLDQSYIDVEVFTSAYPDPKNEKINSLKKSKIKNLNREERINKLLKK